MRAFAILPLIIAACAMTGRGQSCASELQRLQVPKVPRDCVLAPGDAVFILNWRECSLGQPTTIRPDGKITLPLLGDIQAANSTPSEFAARITNLLSVYLHNPEITVTVVDNIRRKYFIVGLVSQPGQFPLDAHVTVLDAINKAAGLKRDANGNKIVVLRGDLSIKLKYKCLLKHPEENMLVENGDHIIIP